MRSEAPSEKEAMKAQIEQISSDSHRPAPHPGPLPEGEGENPFLMMDGRQLHALTSVVEPSHHQPRGVSRG